MCGSEGGRVAVVCEFDADLFLHTSTWGTREAATRPKRPLMLDFLRTTQAAAVAAEAATGKRLAKIKIRKVTTV